jgi:DNA-directed RNA polymerase specialized sigma24 family protein
MGHDPEYDSQFSRARANGNGPVWEKLRRGFGTYFPRLFAYARSQLGEDTASRAIVAEAFATAFEHCRDLPEDEFRLLLFGLVYRLCRSERSRRKVGQTGLTHRESETLALIFDAQLSRAEVARLLKVRAEVVSSSLLRGLRKLRGGADPAAVNVYLGLA